MVMEDQYFNIQWPTSNNAFDELNSLLMPSSIHENSPHTLNHPSFETKPKFEPSTDHKPVDRPFKQLKTDSWSSSLTNNSSNPNPISSPHRFAIPNFANLNPKLEETVSSGTTFMLPFSVTSQANSYDNVDYVLKDSQGSKRVINASNTRVSQAQDHILAERKRREKLSQRFIALSALVPGLKKMDKASVLADSIKYLKYLQEKVKTLEEKTRKKSTESVALVKRYELYTDGENYLTDEKLSGGPAEEPLPEVEARFIDKDVLIRIHCEKRKGVVEKTVGEVEKLHLLVLNTSSMVFANSATDITIIAQMGKEFNMTVKDLVKKLRENLKQFM